MLGCSRALAPTHSVPAVHAQTLDTDGGTAWKTKLDANPHSFESIYKANQPLDVRACTVEADGAHKRVRDALWAN